MSNVKPVDAKPTVQAIPGALETKPAYKVGTDMLVRGGAAAAATAALAARPYELAKLCGNRAGEMLSSGIPTNIGIVGALAAPVTYGAKCALNSLGWTVPQSGITAWLADSALHLGSMALVGAGLGAAGILSLSMPAVLIGAGMSSVIMGAAQVANHLWAKCDTSKLVAAAKQVEETAGQAAAEIAEKLVSPEELEKEATRLEEAAATAQASAEQAVKTAEEGKKKADEDVAQAKAKAEEARAKAVEAKKQALAQEAEVAQKARDANAAKVQENEEKLRELEAAQAGATSAGADSIAA